MTKKMAAAAVIASFAHPVAAWEFVETNICTLSHNDTEMTVEVTFDPAGALYAITLTLPDGSWPNAPSFQLRFDGPRSLVIGTDRHTLNDDGRSLTVTDSGFGNVLDGIQYNTQMTALIGERLVSVSTLNAAAPMEAFRDCPSAPIS